MILARVSKMMPSGVLWKLGSVKCQQQRFLHCTKRILCAPKPYTVGHPVDINNQSVLLPGPDRVRASQLIDDPTKLVWTVPGAKIETIYDVLNHGMKASNNGDCAGMKSTETGEYEWLKYSDAITRIQYVGSALVHSGLKPRSEALVGVFASNRVEFLLTFFACAGYSLVLVPIYSSYGAENVRFIIKQGAFSLVIVNSNKNALNAIQAAKEVPSLKTLILMDAPSPEVTAAAQKAKLSLLHFSEFEKTGKHNRIDEILPKPDDLFCIPYTSGTTGIPKGVMLTHKNIVSCISCLVFGYGPAGVYGGTILSYLPPAHIYEIMNQIVSLYFGRRIAFYEGDIRKLVSDVIPQVKPTVLPLVPRLMNAFYSKAMEHVKDKKWKMSILKFAISRKEASVKKGIISNKTVFDKFLFKKFQEALGGNVHLIITTSAPVAKEVMTFFKCAAGCYVIEGYGQTEILAGTLSLPNDCNGGYVGPPVSCNYIKLVDVPEKNYYAKNDEGEICMKGYNVFQGYFKNPEATQESIDSDGWHHSGDIGRWLPNGALQIIDRKKHLFKLSQGEYIAPEKVENAYIHSKLILQIFVDGFSDKDFAIGIVIPEPTAFQKWAKKKGFKFNEEQIFREKVVRKAFLQELHQCGKEQDLNSLEQVKNIHLQPQPFSVDNGLLTPTLKVKRNVAREHFKSVIDELYKEGPLLEHK